MKPYLRDKAPEKLSEIPDTTAYEAGYLVTKNAGWRNIRPNIDKEKCVGCLRCYLYCPDGVIFKDGGKVSTMTSAKGAEFVRKSASPAQSKWRRKNNGEKIFIRQ